MIKVAINNTKTFEVESQSEGILIDGENFDWDIIQTHSNRFHIIKNHKSYNLDIVNVDYKTKTLSVKLGSKTFKLKVQDRLDILLHKLGMSNVLSQKITELKAPMPGKILEILVQEGDEVAKGDKLGIMEAMKMENIIKSPTDGKIKAVKTEVGEEVEKNHILIMFE